MNDQIKYTEKCYKTTVDLELEIYLIKFEDENIISMNVLKNGKHKHHDTLTDEHPFWSLFKLEQGETITSKKHGETVTCIKVEEAFL